MFYLKNIKKSFTLIELSIVLTVIGILLSISITNYRSIIENLKYKQNNQKILLIQEALYNYFKIYQRLPKPAKYDITRNDTNFGKEITENINNWTKKTYYYASNFIFDKNTNKKKEELYEIGIDTKIFYGIIPFKELKLNEEDVLDVYGNYIEYYVPEIMTTKNKNSIFNRHNDSEKEIIKIGYFEKTQKNGTYDKYFCPSKSAQNPEMLCEKTDNIAYNIKLIQYKIPENYNRLTYIETSGKQFINTGVNPRDGELKILFNITPIKLLDNSEKNCFFSTKKDGFSFEYSNIDNNIFAYFNAGETKYLAKHKTLLAQRNNEYEITYLNDTLAVKGNYNDEAKYTGDLPNDQIYLFSNEDNSCNSSIRLHYLKIYQNGILVRDYVPCVRKDDNQVGLYDIVNNSFCSNIGEGEFIKGLEKQKEYIEYYIPPYGINVKNTQTDLHVKNNNDFAYVILSHGKNGKSTCSISKPHDNTSKPNIIMELTSSNATNSTKYEAQNCINIGSNSYLNIIGRNEFLSSKNKEITFYQGEKSSDFDDICVYKTLTELINHKNNFFKNNI